MMCPWSYSLLEDVMWYPRRLQDEELRGQRAGPVHIIGDWKRQPAPISKEDQDGIVGPELCYTHNRLRQDNGEFAGWVSMFFEENPTIQVRWREKT